MTGPARERGSRARAFAWILTAYAVAGGAAVGVGFLARGFDLLWTAALADLAGTLVIFGFSVAFDNSSFYDAYWSVAPIAIGGCWLFGAPTGDPWQVRSLLVLGLIVLWGIRLTWNWARGWKGLNHEDWRYVDIRRKTGRAYWPASFLGIHLFPTVVVFGGLVAAHPALVANTRPLGWLDVLGVAVTLEAILIEAVADRQLRRHVLFADRTATLSTGLWRYSRHPNYFGEILFWWGLFLFGLAADPSWWWSLAGPAAMTAMFLIISLPMIEGRMLARRPDYATRIATTSLLVPWFPKGDGGGGSQ